MRNQDCSPFFRSQIIWKFEILCSASTRTVATVPYGSVGSGPDADNLGGDPEAGEEVGPGDLSVICRMASDRNPKANHLGCMYKLVDGIKYQPKTGEFTGFLN